MINSTRKYLLTFIEGDQVTTTTISLFGIINGNQDEYEYINALRDDIDKVLDLKTGDHLRMMFNRDNFDSQGVIKRIA